jgi:hypothetical protein
MKLHSIGHLATSFKRSTRRFYAVFIVALVKACLLIGLVETEYEDETTKNLLERLAMCAALAVPLVIGINLVAERRKWKWLVTLPAFVGLAVLMALFFVTTNEDPIFRDYVRFAMFFVAAHLLVSFVPFIGFNEPNGFWQFNKTLFLQFLSATLYAATLFIGIVIAIETVKFLFDIDYGFKIEADLFFLVANLFHTVFFLSGLPDRLELMEQETTYPKGLKIFTQFVLLPLEVIYLVILYVYTGKILVNWQLPDGGVAYLVLAFSVAGIFALLLLYPLREVSGERWIKLFSRRFHIALLPLTVLLFVGIFRRIHDYGITENRYIVAVLAFWLLFITIYFLLSKKDDIRWIPISLCVISVVFAVGPWSVFEVAKRNQQGRFEALLDKYKLQDEKGYIANKAEMSFEDHQQLISIIHFFRDRNSIKELSPFFKQFPKTSEKYTVSSLLEDRVNALVTVKDQQFNEKMPFHLRLGSGGESYDFGITGFDRAFVVQSYRKEPPGKGWVVKAVKEGSSKLRVSKDGKELVVWDIEERVTTLGEQYGAIGSQVSADQLAFDFTNKEYKIRLQLQSVSRYQKKYTFQGILLVGEL